MVNGRATNRTAVDKVDGKTGDGTMPDPARQSQRRNAYLLVLPLTIIAVVTVYLVELGQANVDPFNLVALPLLALLFSLLATAHLLDLLSLRVVEAELFAVTSLAFFGKLGYTLFASYSAFERTHALSQVFIWTPFVYALAFLVGTPKTGLYRAGAVYLVSVALAVVAALENGSLSGYRLGEYYLGNLVLLALLYLVGSLRTRLGELQNNLSEMVRLATLDFLTGVPNRRRLETQLQRELEQHRRYGAPVSVILFDIDNFKKFNDTYGHALGDEVLKKVAGAVQHELRSTDAFGRWGGEEFLVVAGHTDARHATLLAERLRQRVATSEVPGAGTITASFGVAACHADLSLEALIERADAALYQAKSLGKNRVSLDSPDGLPAAVQVPRLDYPFKEVLKEPAPAVVGAVTAWLTRLELGPAPADLRAHVARSFGCLAATLHPYAAQDWQILLGKWYCWAFLHDDRCDGSELGRQPERLKRLTDRLAELFAGAPPRPDDEPLGRALVDLRGELLRAGGDLWLAQLQDELERYFSALAWEAHNRAENTPPSLSRYLEMRPITVGLRLDDLFSRADGLTLPENVRNLAGVAALTRLANELVCWANDLVSLDKELRQGDVHNLVRVLQQAKGLSLQDAVEQASRQHDQTLARFLETEQHVKARLGAWRDLELHLELLRARVRGIYDWSLVSGRYR